MSSMFVMLFALFYVIVTGYFRLYSTHNCARCSLCIGRVLGLKGVADKVVPDCDQRQNKSSNYRCYPVNIIPLMDVTMESSSYMQLAESDVGNLNVTQRNASSGI